MRKWLVSLAGSLLAACGGGGDGGGEDNSWLSFTPTPVLATTYAGESATVTVTARSSRTLSETLYVGLIDSAGVITTDVDVTEVSATEYGIALRVSPNLAPGVHQGEFEVRLCRDAAVTTCANPYPGSPWRVPYRFTVQSGTNLSALRPLAGASAWTTYQGNAAHTGYVPATVDATAFSRRFAWPNAATSVTVEDGRVFTVTGTEFGVWRLHALSESTGQVLWSTSLGTLHRVNAPAVSNGKVYVTSTGHADTFFWTFDAATGSRLARTAMNSQWETYLAPTVYGGKVYTDSGSYGGMSRFDAATSAFEWFSTLYQYDHWTPAVDDNGAYAYAGARLVVLRPSDGASLMSIADPRFSSPVNSMFGAPVLDGQSGVYATQYRQSDASGPRGRLVKFDVANGTLAWDLADQFHSNPVLAAGVLYVVNGDRLEARSPADGALQWSWAAPGGMARLWGYPKSVVVVGNHAFVGTANATHAVNLTTHESVWSHPAVGSLAVSANGVLYISTSTSLVAVNLQ